MKTGLAIFDIHYPHQDKQTLEIFKKVIKDVKPDYLIFGGDNWDAEGISGKFTKQSTDDGIAQTYYEMLEFKKLIFDPLSKTAKETILILGNHDGQRLTDRLLEATQKGKRFITQHWKEKFDYKKIFNCKVIDYNSYIKIGKLYLTHGESTTKHHTKAHLEMYNKSVMYGHLHSKQVFTRITKGNEPHQGISVPCACRKNPDYMKNRASTWINGFALIQWLPNGSFFYQIPQIINGQTIVDGKIYK